MSYLVMESRAGYAVVLDNQGRFQKVPNLGYEVGETLEFVTVLPEETVGVTPLRKKMASLAAAAACFLVLLTGSHQMLLTAYGTVRMQINPDVLLEINRLDYVIGLEGLNEDGGRLVEGYRFKGKRLESVAEDLAGLAVEEGYLKDGGEIVLTVESEHEKWRTDTEMELTEKISAYLEKRASVNVSAGGTARGDEAGSQETLRGNGSQEYNRVGTPAAGPERGGAGDPVPQIQNEAAGHIGGIDGGVDDADDVDDIDADDDDDGAGGGADGTDDGVDGADVDGTDDDSDDTDDGADGTDEDVEDADDGADDVADGADETGAGAADAEEDAGDADDGADDVADGADETGAGAADAEEGAGDADDGADDAADGVDGADGGIDDTTDGVDGTASGGGDAAAGREDTAGVAADDDDGIGGGASDGDDDTAGVAADDDDDIGGGAADDDDDTADDAADDDDGT